MLLEMLTPRRQSGQNFDLGLITMALTSGLSLEARVLASALTVWPCSRAFGFIWYHWMLLALFWDVLHESLALILMVWALEQLANFRTD